MCVADCVMADLACWRRKTLQCLVGTGPRTRLPTAYWCLILLMSPWQACQRCSPAGEAGDSLPTGFFFLAGSGVPHPLFCHRERWRRKLPPRRPPQTPQKRTRVCVGPLQVGMSAASVGQSSRALQPALRAVQSRTSHDPPHVCGSLGIGQRGAHTTQSTRVGAGPGPARACLVRGLRSRHPRLANLDAAKMVPKRTRQGCCKGGCPPPPSQGLQTRRFGPSGRRRLSGFRAPPHCSGAAAPATCPSAPAPPALRESCQIPAHPSDRHVDRCPARAPRPSPARFQRTATSCVTPRSLPPTTALPPPCLDPPRPHRHSLSRSPAFLIFHPPPTRPSFPSPRGTALGHYRRRSCGKDGADP